MLLIGLGVLAVVLVLVYLAFYNTMISKKNQVTNVFATIDALLKKRFDLIPNLISSCQTYMNYEKGTLTQITELRTKAISGNLSDDQKVDLENQMTKLLGGIKIAFENYPDLKASQNFLQLQAALNEVEEQISAARRAYNASVTDYNNAVEMFPTNMIASSMGLAQKKVFEVPEEERKNVNVGELFKK
ncbi:MAG: LemA family protein [Candidatus Omnitrophica bacterium]|nr:LemA family protein [Candidatus Omnitrophota bacterium]